MIGSYQRVLRIILFFGIIPEQVFGRVGGVRVEVGIVVSFFPFPEYLEITPPCQEHSSTEYEQDDLNEKLAGCICPRHRDNYQWLPPRRKMIHRLALPFRWDFMYCEIRRHDGFSLTSLRDALHLWYSGTCRDRMSRDQVFREKDSQWSEDITTTTDFDEEFEATVRLR